MLTMYTSKRTKCRSRGGAGGWGWFSVWDIQDFQQHSVKVAKIASPSPGETN